MRTLALFAFAAFAFSLLVGGIELWWTRQAWMRRHEKTATMLHPFPRDRFRRVRDSRFARARYHVGLFFGFLLAASVGTLLARITYNLLARWF
jgi:hypothetical protein